MHKILNLKNRSMGSDHSEAGESFKREDWEEVERSAQATTWQNRRDPTQRIEEHRLHLASQDECHREREIYYLRKNHPQLVAALYLSSQEGSDFCSSSYHQRLFLEKTPIRLADIEHIPYPDFLHLYSQALRGFAELAQHFGPFAVEEEHIGVNERAVAKVWLNPDFARHHIMGGKVSQEDMVRSIVEIIERNIDPTQLPQRVPPLRDYLFRNGPKLNFQQALTEFNSFVREFANGYIPQKLECIDRVGGIYAIANRERSLQNGQAVQIPQLQQPIQGPQPVYYTAAPAFQPISQQGRPLMAESTVFNTPTQPQNVAVLYPPPTYVPMQEANVLTPSTVRENVPVVRKQATALYNFTIPQPPLQQSSLPEQASIKVGARPPEFKVGQNSAPAQLSNGWAANSNNDPSSIANRLLGQVSNEGRPVIEAPIEPAYFNPQFFQFVPQAPTQPNSNNYAVSPPINSNNNNLQLNYNFSQPLQPPQSTNPALEALAAIQNEAPATISMPKDNIPSISPPELPKFTLPAGEATIQAPPEPSFDFSKNRPQWKAVEVDDGKSSLDFFKKLNELTTISTPFSQPAQSESAQYQNPFEGAYRQQGSANESDFGRNAVSKIVQQASSEGERISQPLRFQSNPKDLKYSIFQESSPQRANYNANFDPQLLQDLQRQSRS